MKVTRLDMQRILIAVLSLLTLSCVSSAQSIPDSELIARLKANRSHFSQWDIGQSLKDRANKLGEDVSRDGHALVDQGQCPDCPKPDPNDDPQVKRATSVSDIVVIGRDVRNISTLTQNEAFVFTDSELIVDEVWKNAMSPEAGPSVSQGSEITIASPGGAMRINGHWIRASLSTRLPLRTGQRYLIYLKYLPDSRSYIQVGIGGFDISSLAVLPLWAAETPPEPTLLSNRPAFLQALHSSTMHAIEEGGWPAH